MRFRAPTAIILKSLLLMSVLSPAAGGAVSVPPSGEVPASSVRVNSDAAEPPSAAAAEGEAVPVWRFYSKTYGGHFYTTRTAERDTLISNSPDIWKYEGQSYTAFTAQAPGTVPLYRFWAAEQKAHFFTASVSERDRIIADLAHDWRYEGVAYYVYPSGVTTGTDVHRFWSPANRRHFYTASASERDGVIRQFGATWRYENAAFRVPSAGIGVKVPPPDPGDSKNCGDFRNYAHAKAWFDQHYASYGDVAKLDNNGDLIPCESLPGAP